MQNPRKPARTRPIIQRSLRLSQTMRDQFVYEIIPLVISVCIATIITASIASIALVLM